MIHPPRSARNHDEKGSVLLIALGFLLLTGTLAAALVGESITNLRTTAVVASINSSITASDAGVSYALQMLRTDSTVCGDPTQGTVTLPAPPTVAGRPGVGPGMQPPGTVQVTCTTIQGTAPGGFGWAVLANDPGPSSITTQSGGAKFIIGPVLNAGGYGLQTPLQVSNGDLYTLSTPCPPANLSVSPSPPFHQHCGTRAVPAPGHLLPTVVPGAPHAPTVNGTCTTLYPGHYTTSNNPNAILSGTAYLSSGVYYFDNLGPITPGVVFGGQPAPGESQYSVNHSPCRSSDPVGAGGEGVANGYGVELVLGGNTTIAMGNGSTFELYTRVPGTADGSTPGISLYQVPCAASGCPTPETAGWTATSLAKSATVFSGGNGAHAESSIHGAVYAPGGSISLFATNSALAALTGGADVWDIAFQSSASASSLMISLATTPGSRRVVITATSTGSGAEKTITSRAVVDLANDAARTVQVDSWRVQQDGP